MAILSKQGCKVEAYLAVALGMGERCRAQLLPERLAVSMLAISMLETQRGSPRGNRCHPPVSGRSQRLIYSFYYYPSPQGDPPGGTRGLKSFHSFADECPTKQMLPPTGIQSSRSPSWCWVLDAAVRFTSRIASSPLYSEGAWPCPGQA